MSTFFFTTNMNNDDQFSKIKPGLDKLKASNDIENWHVDTINAEQILSIETNKLSSEEVKHLLRAMNMDVEFTKAPQLK